MLGFIAKFNSNGITTSQGQNSMPINYTKFRGLNQPSSDTFVKNNTTEPIKVNNSISFKGGFKVPIKEIEQFNKKYFKSLKKMSKEDIIKDNCMTYSNKVRQITQKFDPTAEDYAAKKDFYADYTHELFGSFIGTQQYRLMMLPEDATHEDAMKPMYTVAKHITDTLKRYQECIDKGLDNPNIATPVNKAWELTKECLQEKVKSKNITLHIENEELINNPEFNTHFGYKNYAIMSNILENATKYSPENSHIHAAFKMKDGNIHLTVKDLEEVYYLKNKNP